MHAEPTGDPRDNRDYCQPSVVLVGAYERDNFGDLLYLLLTERYFTGARVVAASPFSKDMTPLLNRRIFAYGPLLDSQRVDHIWTVGGEVGGVTPDSAFWMSTSPEHRRANDRAARRDRQQILQDAYEGRIPDSPYIPRPTAYPKNATATLGLSSVGLAEVDRLEMLHRDAVLSTLRLARPIVVRDQPSSAMLVKHGIAHVLAPDLVQTISLERPHIWNRESDYILVQASNWYLKKVGCEAFGHAIASLNLPLGVRVRLFVAGEANGHDSVAAYGELMSQLKRMRPNLHVEISSARLPWKRVDEIAQARLWIGTSLHGRIVAAAYGVPRISLEVPKVSNYAVTWDSDSPFSVALAHLPAAADEARSIGATADALTGSRDLAELAHRTMREAVDATLEGEYATTHEQRFAALEALREAQVSKLAAEFDGMRLKTQRRPRERLRDVRKSFGRKLGGRAASRR